MAFLHLCIKIMQGISPFLAMTLKCVKYNCIVKCDSELVLQSNIYFHAAFTHFLICHNYEIAGYMQIIA